MRLTKVGLEGVSPLLVVLGFLVTALCFENVDSQFPPGDPCNNEGSNIVVTFYECEEGQILNPPVRAASRLSEASPDTYSLTAQQDPQGVSANYPFSEFFMISPSTVGTGFNIYNIKCIDRDGRNAGIDDDVNMLQYQLICHGSSEEVVYSVLKIPLQDVNDNCPEYQNEPYVVRVNELTPVGMLVYSGITATDKDESINRQVTYSLSDTPGERFDGAGKFTMNIAGEGSVYVGSTLDFESMYKVTGNSALCYYNYTVTARDNGNVSCSRYTFFQVFVDDEDDLGPQYSYSSCIPSTEPGGPMCIRPSYRAVLNPAVSMVLKVMPIPSDGTNQTVDIIAEDRDTLNSQIIFRIARTEPPGYEEYFSVSYSRIGNTKQYKCTVTYILVNNVGLNQKNVPTLQIIIEAIEDTPNRKQETATVYLTLERRNTAPPSIQPSSALGYINENSPIGTFVSLDRSFTALLRLTFSDPDLSPSDPQPQYTITSSDTTFTLTQDGLVQLARNTIDYEIKQQYSLTLTITSPTSPPNTAAAFLTIHVININDMSPVFANTYYTVLIIGRDYSQKPQVLLAVLATDVDYGPVTYVKASVSPSGSDCKFAVSQDGVVSVQGLVKDGDVYFIGVRALDSGNPQKYSDAVVKVTVVACDEPPSSAAASFIVYVSEDIPPSTTVFTLRITDADSIQNISLKMLNPDGTAFTGPFTVKLIGNSAVIISNAVLDFEAVKQYVLILIAVDEQRSHNLLYTAATVTFYVKDVNDNPPVVGSYDFTVSVLETAPLGTAITTTPATDADGSSPNNEIRYKIQSVTPPECYLFYIGECSGILVVSSSLQTNRTVNSCMVNILISDRGVPTLNTNAAVTVRILRNHAPMCGSDYNMTLNDSIPVYTVLTTVTCIDRDTGSVPQFAGVTYHLIGDGNSENFISVNPANGRVSLTRSLTETSDSLLKIRVLATDISGLTDAILITAFLVHMPT